MEASPAKYLPLPLFHLEQASYNGSRLEWQVLLAVILQGAECSDCRNMLLFLVQFWTEVIFHCLLPALFFSAEKTPCRSLFPQPLSTLVLSWLEPENVASEDKTLAVTERINKSVIAFE